MKEIQIMPSYNKVTKKTKGELKMNVTEIRKQYEDEKDTELSALKKLDSKVKRPIKAAAYIAGSVGAVVMGTGMSLIMTDISEYFGIADPMTWGILIGVVGMAIMIANFPIYKVLFERRRKKFAPEIIALADKISER